MMPNSVHSIPQDELPEQRRGTVQPLHFDTGSQGFIEECRRQAELTAAADRADPELMGFLDAALVDLCADLK